MSDKKKSGPWSPPSGKSHPPAAGVHAPTPVHKVKGGESAPNQAAGIHPSVKKPKLMG
jgi:hypothetical protein